jgi:hypothetical protein
VPAGKSTLDNDGKSGEPGKGGTGTLFINDKKVGEARIGKTVPGRFGIDPSASAWTPARPSPTPTSHPSPSPARSGECSSN